MSRILKTVFFAVCMILTICIAGCGRQTEEETGKTYNIYYINNEETKVFSSPYQTTTENEQELLKELLGQLEAIPEKMEYKAPLAGNFELLNYTWDGEQLTLNFDEYYKELDGIMEVLVRAAVVRTLSQINNISYVSFTVQNEPLTDHSGMAVGIMSEDMFIDNAGNEINTYEKVNLHLYFANEAGDRLIEEERRNVVYSSNISLEKLIVEKLIEGPAIEDHYPTINPDTKIINVTIIDNICYVNLDETFLNQPYNVTSAVTIYSIANSLAELTNVHKVQISINGETSVSYKESINLNTVFERNLDLVENAASGE